MQKFDSVHPVVPMVKEEALCKDKHLFKLMDLLINILQVEIITKIYFQFKEEISMDLILCLMVKALKGGPYLELIP